VHSERDIQTQVAKYMNIDAFKPRRGGSNEEHYKVGRAAICLVMDQAGIYVARSNSSGLSELLIPREELATSDRATIRNRLVALVFPSTGNQ
jgi:hypothetical protein